MTPTSRASLFAVLLVGCGAVECVTDGGCTAPNPDYCLPCVEDTAATPVDASEADRAMAPPDLATAAPVDAALPTRADAAPPAVDEAPPSLDAAPPAPDLATGDLAAAADLTAPPVDLAGSCSLPARWTHCYDYDGGDHVMWFIVDGLIWDGGCKPIDDPTKIVCGAKNCSECPGTWHFFAGDGGP